MADTSSTALRTDAAAVPSAPVAASTPPEPAFRAGISDADIIRQAEEIRADVAASQPLVSDILPAQVLLPKYADNPVFLAKLQDFCTKYRGIRATRGDGNCFYRSFLISLGEAFVAAGVKPAGTADASAGPMQAKYEQLLQYVDGSAEKLLALGYPDITIPDFHSEMLAFLTSLSAPGATPDTVAATFRDPSLGLYIITYLRCLCSLELLTHEDDYFAFILGLAPHCATVQHFCNTEVEAVHTDADQIQIIALAKAWGVRVRIAYLDATPGMTASEIVFPEDGSVDAAAGAPVEVTLLYRPGHYDVAYAK